MIFQHELIRSLRSNSTRKAIETGDRAVRYADLLEGANKVTLFLLKNGLGKGDIVGIQLDDRVDMITAMIGVLNAGCIFVLLDAALPVKRLTTIIKDLDLAYTISCAECPQVADRATLRTVRNYFLRDILDNPVSGSIAYPAYGEDDSIYIYYTSGSEGRPKGVVGKNSSLLQFLQWEINAFGISGETRVSQLISPYFDAFLRDVFVPLLAGGTICLPPSGDDLFSPDRLVPWIAASNITLIHCVPSLFRVINSGQATAAQFERLKFVLLSGEKIMPSELEKWYKVFGSRTQLVNLYGATETTMIRSCYLIRPEDAGLEKISIGSPIDGTELIIANKRLQSCQTLIPGDLYIVSDHMTKGYLNDPGLTHDKFILLDAGTGKGRPAFRTGDKARVLANGQIDLLGREDRIVKLRGIRIELDEIEFVMVRSGLVKNAVVVVNAGMNEEESLLAFVTREPDEVKDDDWAAALRLHLQEYLPVYMVPADIRVVSEFPLLSNGKIDYKALKTLPVPDQLVLPANDTEAGILAIWKEILGNKPMSTEDSFHRIGGNSLSIMKLIGRLYKEYNVRISLNELFNNLSIKKQAELIRRSNKDLQYLIPKSPLKAFYHVSSAQERMYYNQRMQKDSVAYNLPMAWQISGVPDKHKIEQVFRLLIGRHESLRTVFQITDDQLYQYIKEVPEFELEEIRGKHAAEAIAGFIRPFDLDKAPLLRAAIVKTPAGENILVADLHHIICDGMSQLNLLSDFARLYKEEAVPPLERQYKDYAEWEYNFKSTEEYIASREFWLRSFEGGIPEIRLPTTHVAAGGTADTGGSVFFSIPKRELKPLLDHLHKEDITMFAGLFSLYFLFLSQITGQDDLVIGTAASGRMQQELENLVGMFVKTLPIRCRMDADMSFSDLLKNMNDLLIRATSRQAYDLTNIVIDLKANSAWSGRSLFDVVFVFQNFEQTERKNGNDEFSLYQLESPSSKYPISLFAGDSGEFFEFRLEYLSAYFTKEDVELLIAQFKSLVERASENLHSAIVKVIGDDAPLSNLIEDDISFNF